MTPRRPVRALLPSLLLALSLGACALQDGRLADRARTRLVGLREVDLEACLGGPDQHSSFGSTDVLTYYLSSSSAISYTIPIVGGLGFSNGGSCHATFRIDGGRVTHVIYSGEKNATFAPNAYCAPIVRSCLAELDRNPSGVLGVPGTMRATATSSGSQAVNNTPAPQPGRNAAAPAGVPSATPLP